MGNVFRLLHFMETFFALAIVSTGDVAYGARQYVSLTRDIKWLNDAQDINKKTGFDLLLETARFWASRATPNKQNKYDINGKSVKIYHPTFLTLWLSTNTCISLKSTCFF